jgi:hypothetical protein
LPNEFRSIWRRRDRRKETFGDASKRRRELKIRRHRRWLAKKKAEKKVLEVGSPLRTYEDLVQALRIRRQSLNLSQADVDAIAGFHDGYTAKLEIGLKLSAKGSQYGRGLGDMSLPTILDALGVRLMLVER